MLTMLLTKVNYLRRRISQPDYKKSRALQMAESMGAWLVEWNCKPTASALRLFKRYQRKMNWYLRSLKPYDDSNDYQS